MSTPAFSTTTVLGSNQPRRLLCALCFVLCALCFGALCFVLCALCFGAWLLIDGWRLRLLKFSRHRLVNNHSHIAVFRTHQTRKANKQANEREERNKNKREET